MNKKVIAVVWVLALAVLVGGALIIYNYLSGSVETPTNLAPPAGTAQRDQALAATQGGTQESAQGASSDSQASVPPGESGNSQDSMLPGAGNGNQGQEPAEGQDKTQYPADKVESQGKPEAPSPEQSPTPEQAPPPDPTTTQAPEPAQTDTPNPQDGQSEADDDMFLAPDFTVLDSNGAEVRLSDLFGKPIVINFWASWCPPCKSEMPEFNKVYREMGADVIFMMIDLVDGQRETVETGARYVAEQGFTFPVYFDTSGEAGYYYGISSIPTTIFIDRDGYIITGAIGAIDEQTLRLGIGYIR